MPPEISTKGISAAEKYAEVGDQRPRCECHGELMKWHKSGNCWICAIRVRAQQKDWERKNREYIRAKDMRLYYKNHEKYLERARRQGDKRRDDPEYRRKQVVYMLQYRHRMKKESYANQGLTFGNDGEESRPGEHRPAA